MFNHTISMSLFGYDKKYINGALANCKLLPEIFPNSQLVFTVPQNYDPEIIQKLLNHNNVKVIKKNSTIPLKTQFLQPKFSKNIHETYGLVARFFSADNQPQTLLSVRDCDSRLCQRDRVLIDSFANSQAKFHIIRDHPSHLKYRVRGGMWSIKNPPNFTLHFYDWLKTTKHSDHDKAFDEQFLNDIIPRLNFSTLIHSVEDPNHSKTVPYNSNFEFIGQTFAFDGTRTEHASSKLKQYVQYHHK